MREKELISRENYADVLAYLDYQERVRQCTKDTIKRKWGYLRHLLEWAGANTLFVADKIRLSFPTYLLTARNDGKEKSLSAITMKRTCLETQEFYHWAKIHRSVGYKKVSEQWIDTIRLSKGKSNQIRLEDRKYYTQEEVLKLCDFEHEILIDKRDRAALAMLYLSSMRISAFVSLPVRCVDIQGMTIYQLPEEGVKTKNSKPEITVLLPIDELLTIVNEWDRLVRSELGENALWYPSLSTDGLRWSNSVVMGDTEARRKSFRRGLQKMCKRVGIEYKSSHKLRRGHGVYAVKHSRDYEEFQAYSQNMGHEDPGTTFKYYSKLSKDNVRAIILRGK